jgi:alkane 1-monooxygenase
MRALAHFFGYLTTASVLVGYGLGGAGCFFTLVYVYLLLPPVEWLLGSDTSDPNGPADGPRRAPLAYRLPLYLHAPIQIALTLWLLQAAASGRLSLLETVGMTVSLGIVTGAIGITAAHELMHRTGASERLLARLLMTWVSYPHFCIEHVRGHHRWVATPADPASARLGEGLYAFLSRCVAGSLVSAWRLEAERLARLGRTPLDRRNEMIWMGLAVAALYGGVGHVFGAVGLAMFAGQSAVAILLLETVNYLEHYGLERAEIAPGRYEKVAPRHSWNSNHRVTNWSLFNLGSHDDHHRHAGRPYPALAADADDAPALPAGYTAMFMLAAVPPLWRRVMDRRVAAARAMAPAAGGD